MHMICNLTHGILVTCIYCPLDTHNVFNYIIDNTFQMIGEASLETFYWCCTIVFSEGFVKNSQKVQQTITNLEQNLTTGESFKEYMNTKN